MAERISNRRQAREAHKAALAEWNALAEAAWTTWWEGLVTAVRDAGGPAHMLLALHVPVLEGDFRYGLTCPSCYYDYDHAPAPCGTALVAAAAVAYAEAPTLTPPVFEDFYVEPDVDVVFAHHTLIGGVYYKPLDTLTMPLSAAQRIRARMTRESWQAVEKLSS